MVSATVIVAKDCTTHNLAVAQTAGCSSFPRIEHLLTNGMTNFIASLS